MSSSSSSSSLRLDLVTVPLPADTNVIVGQSHFIKSVEDIFEACASVGGGIKFGLAFSEASGPCLIRNDGTSEELAKEASKFLLEELRCGHTFLVYILSPHFPINVLNSIKTVPEVRAERAMRSHIISSRLRFLISGYQIIFRQVCNIFAATANPLKIVVAEDGAGCRGILGVIDGFPPQGIENEEQKKERKDFLRMIGYKR